LNKSNFKKRDIGPKVVANNRIRCKTVRVSFPDGDSQILSIEDAQRSALELDLDLVLITETADPPVCKITDLAKFIYASKQKDKLAKRKQRESVVETKEIRLGINIDIGDITTKAKQARKFLDKNNKVTVTIILKGRERGKSDRAKELLNTFADTLGVEYENISIQNNRVTGKI
jgi:translation initiation factor IF-3